MAVTLGVGMVVGFAYVAADRADLIDGDSVFIPVVFSVVYMVACVVGNLKYR